jgi:hypothetical protein
MPTNGADTARLELLVPRGLKDRLQSHAAAEDRSVSSAARQLLSKALEPLNGAELATFGHDAERDPATGRCFEQGSGSYPRPIQSKIFAEEARRGRPLTGWEVAAIVRGNTLEDAATDAAKSIEDLK